MQIIFSRNLFANMKVLSTLDLYSFVDLQMGSCENNVRQSMCDLNACARSPS